MGLGGPDQPRIIPGPVIGGSVSFKCICGMGTCAGEFSDGTGPGISTGSPRFGSGRFGSYRFRFIPVPVQKISKNEKISFFVFCQLLNGFWTLPGGPLDPLDQYKNPLIFYFLNFCSYIFIVSL